MAVRPRGAGAPGRRRPAVLASRRSLEREGVFSWLMLAPPRALPARVRRLPVLLRHLPEPSGPAGGQAGRVRRARQLRHALRTTRCSGRSSRNTFIYTVGRDACSRCSGGLGMALVMNQNFRCKNLDARAAAAAVHRAHRASTIAWHVDPRPRLQRGQLAAGARPAWPISRARPGSATPTWRCSRSSSSTPGAACRSTASPCSPACRPSRPSSTRRRPSTAPAAAQRFRYVTLPLSSR